MIVTWNVDQPGSWPISTDYPSLYVAIRRIHETINRMRAEGDYTFIFGPRGIEVYNHDGISVEHWTVIVDEEDEKDCGTDELE